MMKYKKIIEQIRRENVTLFVGSGCSIASNAPSSKELTNKIWSLLKPDYQDDDIKNILQEVSEYLVIQENNNRTKLNNVLIDAFKDLKPSSFHQKLLQVPHFHTIITTNYDSLIESAYTLDYFQVIANNSELVSANSQKVHLLKIHGDTKHLKDIVITKTDYRHFLESPKNSLLWNRVIAEFTSKHIVFIGYSADDQNILNLIESIKKRCDTDIKQMFLIAPALKKVQEERMKNMGVNIIKGTGDEFLETTIAALKESFGEDKYNNNCSQDTLARFALLNGGVQFSFEYDGRHTKITRWSTQNGDPCPLKVNFSTKPLDIIGSRTPTTAAEIVKGFSVPMYALTPEELTTFRMSVKGLRINGDNEMQEVLIGPATKELSVAFTSHDYSIDCRCKARRYTNNHILHILIPTPIYNLELKLDFSDTSRETCTGNFTTTLNDGFDDLSEAIRWTQMLTSLQDNMGLTMHLGPLQISNLSISKTNKSQPEYKDWLNYCLNLSDIEKATNTIIPHYDGFTPENFFYSKILKSYLKHEAFIDKTRKEYKSFTVDVDKGWFERNGDYVLGVVTKINGPISLCGLNYSIAQEKVIMTSCRIESLGFIDGEKERLKITNQLDNIQYEYSDEDESDHLIDKA